MPEIQLVLTPIRWLRLPLMLEIVTALLAFATFFYSLFSDTPFADMHIFTLAFWFGLLLFLHAWEQAWLRRGFDVEYFFFEQRSSQWRKMSFDTLVIRLGNSLTRRRTAAALQLPNTAVATQVFLVTFLRRPDTPELETFLRWGVETARLLRKIDESDEVTRLRYYEVLDRHLFAEDARSLEPLVA